MTYDPDGGELLPDGSRIQVTTVGELVDWLASQPAPGPRPPCDCADPQPYNLCCPAKLIYPAYARPRRGR